MSLARHLFSRSRLRQSGKVNRRAGATVNDINTPCNAEPIIPTIITISPPSLDFVIQAIFYTTGSVPEENMVSRAEGLIKCAAC